jgi:Trypsin-co-occurring domain 1
VAENLVGFSVGATADDELFFEQSQPASAARTGQESRTVRASFGKPGILERTGTSLEEALRRVKPAAEVILDQFRSLSSEVQQIEIEFGIKFTAAAGAVIAAASTEGHCVVKLTLVRAPRGEGDEAGSS